MSSKSKALSAVGWHCPNCTWRTDFAETTAARFGNGDLTALLAETGPAVAAAATTVDVLVFYTPATLGVAGSTEAVLAKANSMITSLKAVLSSSQTDNTVRLPGISQITNLGADAYGPDLACLLLKGVYTPHRFRVLVS